MKWGVKFGLKSTLTVKKWFGIASSIAWILFLLAVGGSIVLVTLGTVFHNVAHNIFEKAGGPAATGLPLLWFFATVYYLPVDAVGDGFLDKLAKAAAKGLRPVAYLAGGVAGLAFILEMLSDPVILFGRTLVQDILPIGKQVSKGFTAVWAGLMVICLIVLLRLRSFSLAAEVFFELIKESLQEIWEFYVDLYEYLFAGKSA